MGSTLLLVFIAGSALRLSGAVDSIDPLDDQARTRQPSVVVMDTVQVRAKSLDMRNCPDTEKVRAFHFDLGSPASLLERLLSADRAQALRIGWMHQIEQGIDTGEHKTLGMISDYPISAFGPDLDPMLAMAVAVHVGQPEHFWLHCPRNKFTCTFAPTFAVRFFNGDEWLDVLVSHCLFLGFYTKDGRRVGGGTLDPDSGFLERLLEPVVQGAW